MATNMGISGAEAANVVGSFARMNEGSAATAMDMAATTKAMGKAAGVPIVSSLLHLMPIGWRQRMFRWFGVLQPGFLIHVLVFQCSSQLLLFWVMDMRT